MSHYECVIEHGYSFSSFFGFCVSFPFQFIVPILIGLFVGFILIKRF